MDACDIGFLHFCVVCSFQDKDDKSDKRKESTVTTQTKQSRSADLDELIGDMAWCSIPMNNCC